jgi:hypothetical protein
MAKDPTDVIRKAVLRMLPKNNLRDVSALYTNIFGIFFFNGVWNQITGAQNECFFIVGLNFARL